VIVHLKVTVFNLYEFLYAAEHTKNIYILKNVGNQTVDFSGSQWELFDCQNASKYIFCVFSGRRKLIQVSEQNMVD